MGTLLGQRAFVSRIDVDRKFVRCTEILSDGTKGRTDDVVYGKLAICTGAVPTSIAPDIPRVLCIRDDTSVAGLCAALKDARRILLVGNGGIAMELSQAVTSCELVWAVKNKYIGNTFFDASASAFFYRIRRCGGA